jgi:hypothetical protein
MTEDEARAKVARMREQLKVNPEDVEAVREHLNGLLSAGLNRELSRRSVWRKIGDWLTRR